jgi:hypothetical protein
MCYNIKLTLGGRLRGWKVDNISFGSYSAAGFVMNSIEPSVLLPENGGIWGKTLDSHSDGPTGPSLYLCQR